MIQIKNLSKSFGSKKVLHDISLDIHKGKVYGLVGPNGSGKTTLFRCIAGLETFDGDFHSEYKSLKDHLGFLDTNPRFMSLLTAWEYLKLMCIARGVKEDDFDSQNIFELPLGEYAENYSTGMKKKLAIMAILLQQNDVFILDEPYNGVDIHSNIIITEIIRKLKAAGKTVLISSHIFSTLSDTCDEIHLLKEGRINKSVGPSEFSSLEEEMKSFIIGDQLDNLQII